jgi:FG-GAP-like repeat
MNKGTQTASQTSRLDSWKEIAAHLGRDVRTVIRWEKERALPVHRVPGGLRNSVFALTRELDAWVATESFETAPPVLESPRRNRKWHLWTVVITLLAIALSIFAAQRLGHRGGERETVSLTTPSGKSIRFAVERIQLAGVFGVAAGDLNGDSITDLVATSLSGSNVSVFLGQSDGHFSAPVMYHACAGTMMPAIADFNGDGISDLAVTCTSAIAILTGDGHGHFHKTQELSVPCPLFAPQVADFNKDGWADLAVTCRNGDITVFRNEHGSLRQAFTFESNHDLRFLSIADFDGDGFPDIVTPVGRDTDSLTLLVLFGDHDLKFRDRITVRAPIGQSGLGNAVMSSADFNHDGRPDFAASNGDGTFYAFLNLGNRSFSAARVTRLGESYSVSTAIDLDGDGIADLFTTLPFANRAQVHFGHGDGTFGEAHKLLAADYANVPVVADINGDRHPDLIFTSFPAEQILILKSQR